MKKALGMFVEDDIAEVGGAEGLDVSGVDEVDFDVEPLVLCVSVDPTVVLAVVLGVELSQSQNNLTL